MGDTKTKTKAAMLNELESIKGLLLEEDDIPILQEVIEQQTAAAPIPEESASQTIDKTKTTFEPQEIVRQKEPSTYEPKAPEKTPLDVKTIFEEQQDFFSSPIYSSTHHEFEETQASANDLLKTLSDLEKHTEEATANRPSNENHKTGFNRPSSLAKATGENPFLPEHIRARLHGNNPPPLFANETARKIANTSIPSRQLGNTSFGITHSAAKPNNHQQDIIDSIIEKMMPEIEKELRSRLEMMSKNLLDDLNK